MNEEKAFTLSTIALIAYYAVWLTAIVILCIYFNRWQLAWFIIFPVLISPKINFDYHKEETKEGKQ